MRSSRWLKRVMILSLLLLALPAAADGDHINVFIMSTSGETSTPLIAQGIVDVLDAFGIVDRADFDVFRRSIHNDMISLSSAPVDLDVSLARAQIQENLDQNPDIIVLSSVTLTQLAATATRDLEDPPTLFFVGVDDPYGAGLADSPCVKLPNLTGSESVVPYADMMAALPKLDPSITTVGTLYNSGDPAGARGAAQIAEIGEAMGLTVEVSAYTDFSTMAAAADGLISKGVEALALPLETGAGQILAGVLSPLAVENRIPIVAADAGLTYAQATIGVGNINHYLWGINVGRLLVADIQGELDIASAAISPSSLALSVGVNLNVAAASGLEIPPGFMDEADFTVDNMQGNLTEKGRQNTWQVESMRALGEFLQRFTTPETFAFVQEAELPDLREGQAEFIKSVRCTPERIAEEQAKLDADA